MSSDPQPDKRQQSPAANHSAPASNHSAQGADPSAEGEQFTPEQLRKAARVQVILYVVMAVMILAPFVVMWLRKE